MTAKTSAFDALILYAIFHIWNSLRVVAEHSANNACHVHLVDVRIYDAKCGPKSYIYFGNHIWSLLASECSPCPHTSCSVARRVVCIASEFSYTHGVLLVHSVEDFYFWTNYAAHTSTLALMANFDDLLVGVLS